MRSTLLLFIILIPDEWWHHRSIVQLLSVCLFIYVNYRSFIYYFFYKKLTNNLLHFFLLYFAHKFSFHEMIHSINQSTVELGWTRSENIGWSCMKCWKLQTNVHCSRSELTLPPILLWYSMLKDDHNNIKGVTAI